MSKSQFKRLLIQHGHLPLIPTGNTAELEGHATTMWTEKNAKCPVNPKHTIARSTHRYYCHTCGTYWDMETRCES